jgi:hypothetical protein
VTRIAKLALALVGTAVTLVVAQYGRNVDRSVAATAAATFRVQASDGNATKVGPRVAGEPEIIFPERGATMPARGARPGAVPGAANPIDVEADAETTDAEPATVLGIPLPAWVDTMLGRRSPVGGGMPVRSTENPPSTVPNAAALNSVPAGATACRHDLAPNPQGITAQVDFVGVLLNGQQRAGDSFSGAELDDLKILVEWKSLFQNHAQRVDLIAPDGSLYQSLSRIVTAADIGAPAETRVPVNGSWITRYGLYGSWCVEIFIDQDSAPVTSSRLVIARPQ